jgi:nucleotide-binding universal stress UspA family protein
MAASRSARDDAPVVICYDGSGEATEALAVETARSAWEAIEQVAHETDARMIACGSGKSGVKATVPTILPNALVRRSSKAVLVVPSSKAAGQRRREIEKH